jgi:hypothetical protein
MINYADGIETLTSRNLEQEKDYRIEKVYPLSPCDISMKKVKRRSGFKKRIALCNWTMPAQPQGYIRAGKYDLL